MAVNLTELVATTLRKRGSLADNVTNHNGLLFTMEDRGNIKNAGGGRDLTEPLLYNELATKFYDGFETFTIDTSQEVVDAAVYDWKQLGGFSFISGKEKIMNRSKWQAISIAESRIDALIAGLRNKTGKALYSLGTADGGKEFGGLRLLVADNPAGAGTVGGIDQVANPWWQNQAKDVANAWTTIQADMNDMQLRCTRGADQPDLWVASKNPFVAYWESLQAIQRVGNAKMADAGFRTLEFIGVPVVYDAQCAEDLTSGTGPGRMYALNTNFLKFQKAPERWFSTEEARKVENADYDVIPNWTMGNMTTNARFLQGVLWHDGS
jgi:hypothetical protein